MKITNLKSGIPYQLKPGTQLEVERTNPFFNEYGEQTLPLEIPDTDQNRVALGYPDQLCSNKKQADISALIEDGDYYAICKQAILSAQRKGNISTSFYINQGSFYSSLQKTDLKTIFEGEVIPGISTVEEGIDFCRALRYNKNDHFAIFPILIKDDSGEAGEGDLTKYKYINRWGHWLTDKKELFMDGTNTAKENDFYNAEPRTEIIDDIEISLSAGYYISPFIRAYYVLQRIFQYFGYTLLDNFFSRTDPFNKMVFVNNVADVLVNGSILISQLVPDVKCNDIINLFRHKFCCEFIADEVAKTVSIELFSDIVASSPEVDLTKCLVGNYTVEYPETYKQLKLTSKFETEHEVTENFESLSMFLSKYPQAYFRKSEGVFIKKGFKGFYNDDLKLTESSTSYYAGGSYETHEIEIEECIPDFRISSYGFYSFVKFLYIGNYQMMNSKLVKKTQDKEDVTPADNYLLYPMLAFPYIDTFGDAAGTVTNYERSWISEKRIFDYSLCYYGEDGIFEKFYRPLDTLLRNSLHTVRADLLLSKTDKRLLPAHKKYTLCNQEVFINKLSFLIGGESEPKESELLTLKLYEPITQSPHLSDIMVNWEMKYYWVGGIDYTPITEEEYNSSSYPKKPEITDVSKYRSPMETLYPPPPTAEDIGKDKCHEIKYLTSFKDINSTQYTLVSQYVKVSVHEE